MTPHLDQDDEAMLQIVRKPYDQDAPISISELTADLLRLHAAGWSPGEDTRPILGHDSRTGTFHDVPPEPTPP